MAAWHIIWLLSDLCTWVSGGVEIILDGSIPVSYILTTSTKKKLCSMLAMLNKTIYHSS